MDGCRTEGRRKERKTMNKERGIDAKEGYYNGWDERRKEWRFEKEVRKGRLKDNRTGIWSRDLSFVFLRPVDV